MAIPVTAPVRKPRAGGIKTVVGDFVAESRLSVSQGGIAFEDSGCGKPARTRAGCYAPIEGVNEVQRLTITGTPTGGSFTLTYAGETTTALNHNASVATIQAALDALSNVDPGDITVAGGPLPGTFVTFTFGGGLAETNVSEMTATPSLTGGSAPTAVITTTTPGAESAGFIPDGINQYTSILSGPFAVYKGVECYIGGDATGGSYQEQASAALEAWEDREVEQELWDWAVAAPTPGTAANIARAISLAEDYADDNYVGQPVILMSRRYTSKADLKNDEGVLRTVNGTPVIAVGGIALADTDMVVAIGMPAVYASRVFVQDATDHDSNVTQAIAQRIYDLAVDCDFRYAVTATTP
jgi:hypothetical protein